MIMTCVMTIDLPTLRDIDAASVRLRGHSLETPLTSSLLLNARLGAQVLFKLECLQYTGSFKFRGAFTRIDQIPDQDRKKGVIAYSSGNHAQGVAAAAHRFGLKATIIMAADAPKIKVTHTRAWGAEIIFYDRHHDNREEIGTRLAHESGSTLIKPYDDPQIIAGQGTIGLEIFRQALAMGFTHLDVVLVPCGGGGLVSGIAFALSSVSPQTEIYAVEPVGFDDTAQSLSHGYRIVNSGSQPSICDALLAPTPGEITFMLNKQLLTGSLVVTDAEVRHAMVVAFEYLKVVVEPGGAVALAALLSGHIACKDKTIAVVCSGGNVDAQFFTTILAEHTPLSPDT